MATISDQEVNRLYQRFITETPLGSFEMIESMINCGTRAEFFANGDNIPIIINVIESFDDTNYTAADLTRKLYELQENHPFVKSGKKPIKYVEYRDPIFMDNDPPCLLDYDPNPKPNPNPKSGDESIDDDDDDEEDDTKKDEPIDDDDEEDDTKTEEEKKREPIDDDDDDDDDKDNNSDSVEILSVKTRRSITKSSSIPKSLLVESEGQVYTTPVSITRDWTVNYQNKLNDLMRDGGAIDFETYIEPEYEDDGGMDDDHGAMDDDGGMDDDHGAIDLTDVKDDDDEIEIMENPNPNPNPNPTKEDSIEILPNPIQQIRTVDLSSALNDRKEQMEEDEAEDEDGDDEDMAEIDDEDMEEIE